MVYKVPKIMEAVRIAIDENRTSEELLLDEDVDTLTLNDIIYSKIEEGVRVVINAVPSELLEGGVHFGDSVFWRENCSGWIILPDDFLRLKVFKMSDWGRPVFDPITVSDAKYKQQFSRCKGLRGTTQKPVAAIVRRPEGLVLEFFSCKNKEAFVEQGMYVPLPKIDQYGGIDIPERCFTAVVYMIASLVLGAIGQTEQMGVMTELSKQNIV